MMLTTKKPKLTASQIDVLQRLAGGWEAGDGGRGRSWMQRGGLGRGGDYMQIRSGTLVKLYRLGLVAAGKCWSGPGLSTPYHITDAGRALVAAEAAALNELL